MLGKANLLGIPSSSDLRRGGSEVLSEFQGFIRSTGLGSLIRVQETGGRTTIEVGRLVTISRDLRGQLESKLSELSSAGFEVKSREICGALTRDNMHLLFEQSPVRVRSPLVVPPLDPSSIPSVSTTTVTRSGGGVPTLTGRRSSRVQLAPLPEAVSSGYGLGQPVNLKSKGVVETAVVDEVSLEVTKRALTNFDQLLAYKDSSTSGQESLLKRSGIVPDPDSGIVIICSLPETSEDKEVLRVLLRHLVGKNAYFGMINESGGIEKSLISPESIERELGKEAVGAKTWIDVVLAEFRVLDIAVQNLVGDVSQGLPWNPVKLPEVQLSCVIFPKDQTQKQFLKEALLNLVVNLNSNFRMLDALLEGGSCIDQEGMSGMGLTKASNLQVFVRRLMGMGGREYVLDDMERRFSVLCQSLDSRSSASNVLYQGSSKFLKLAMSRQNKWGSDDRVTLNFGITDFERVNTEVLSVINTNLCNFLYQLSVTENPYSGGVGFSGGVSCYNAIPMYVSVNGLSPESVTNENFSAVFEKQVLQAKGVSFGENELAVVTVSTPVSEKPQNHVPQLPSNTRKRLSMATKIDQVSSSITNFLNKIQAEDRPSDHFRRALVDRMFIEIDKFNITIYQLPNEVSDLETLRGLFRELIGTGVTFSKPGGARNPFGENEIVALLGLAPDGQGTTAIPIEPVVVSTPVVMAGGAGGSGGMVGDMPEWLVPPLASFGPGDTPPKPEIAGVVVGNTVMPNLMTWFDRQRNGLRPTTIKSVVTAGNDVDALGPYLTRVEVPEKLENANNWATAFGNLGGRFVVAPDLESCEQGTPPFCFVIPKKARILSVCHEGMNRSQVAANVFSIRGLTVVGVHGAETGLYPHSAFENVSDVNFYEYTHSKMMPYGSGGEWHHNNFVAVFGQQKVPRIGEVELSGELNPDFTHPESIDWLSLGASRMAQRAAMHQGVLRDLIFQSQNEPLYIAAHMRGVSLTMQMFVEAWNAMDESLQTQCPQKLGNLVMLGYCWNDTISRAGGLDQVGMAFNNPGGRDYLAIQEAVRTKGIDTQNLATEWRSCFDPGLTSADFDKFAPGRTLESLSKAEVNTIKTQRAQEALNAQYGINLRDIINQQRHRDFAFAIDSSFMVTEV